MKTLKISEETCEKIKNQLEDEEVKPIVELEDLVGHTYIFWCARYIYHGKVKAVNSSYVTLEDAGVVYETGELGGDSAKDIQVLPHDGHVMIQSIESFTKMNW